MTTARKQMHLDEEETTRVDLKGDHGAACIFEPLDRAEFERGMERARAIMRRDRELLRALAK